jgi:Tol biopolymer transport system component
LFEAADAQYKPQLWSISYPQRQVRRFTHDLSSYDVYSLQLTRDGSALVAVQRNTEANIFIAPGGDAAQAKQITNGEARRNLQWTPDGKLVTRSEAGKLSLMDAAGQQIAVLEDGPVGTDFSVCGDGKNVLSEKLTNGDLAIWRAALDGSGTTQVEDGAIAPWCSPDGKWFTAYYDKGIWRYPIAGGNGQMLVGNTGGPPRSAISPDGKLVAYVFQEPSNGTILEHLGVIPSEGGALLHRFPMPFGVGGLHWAPDSRGVEYAIMRDGARNIWEQPLDGSAAKQVTHFPSGDMFDYAWSADGKQLAVSRGSIRTDVVRISNFSK